MNRVLVVFSDGLLSELDSARGLVSRSAWIRQAVEEKLMKEAVAPLVPDFFVCNCGHPETLHRKNGAFAPCQIALCECQQFSKPVPQLSVEGEPLNEYEMATGYRQEPKPKARRKKKVAEPEESIDLMVALKDSIKSGDITLPVRCHCKRGMIIAAGPRKGQCTVCGNPKPLKGSK